MEQVSAQYILRDIVNTTMTSQGRMPRFKLLEDYPALMDRGWLPAADEWPEFGELRDEHHRLLDACDRAIRIASETNARFRAEDDQVAAEMKAALKEGREEKHDLKVTPTEERRKEGTDNRTRITVAITGLEEFLEGAINDVKELAPGLYEGLATEDAEAEAKRQEAARLVAEAEVVAAEVQRKRMWLNRESGPKTPMSHFPFEQVAAPLPEEKVDLEAALADGGSTVVEVVGG
jgi:hypothetical protein